MCVFANLNAIIVAQMLFVTKEKSCCPADMWLNCLLFVSHDIRVASLYFYR